MLASAFATVICTNATPSRAHSQPLNVSHLIGCRRAQYAGQYQTYNKNIVFFGPDGCIWKFVSLTNAVARTTRACATGACGTPALLPCCYWNSSALREAAASKGQVQFATRKSQGYRKRLRLRNVFPSDGRPSGASWGVRGKSMMHLRGCDFRTLGSRINFAVFEIRSHVPFSGPTCGNKYWESHITNAWL